MSNKVIEQQEKTTNPTFALINNFLLRYFKITLVVFTILILGLGYFFILKPKYAQIKEDVAAANENIENTSNNLEAYLSGLNNYIKQYDRVNTDLQEKISKVLPLGNNKEELYVLMEQIAHDENLFLTSIEILDSKNKNKDVDKKKVTKVPAELGVINIDVNFIGVDYSNLKSLLNILEKSLQIIDIRDINFNYATKNLALSLETYYLKLE